MTGLGEVFAAAALAAVLAAPTACSGGSPPDVLSCRVTLGDAASSIDLPVTDGQTASAALRGYTVNFQIQHAGTFVHAEMIGLDNTSLGAFDAGVRGLSGSATTSDGMLAFDCSKKSA
ncbi:MAG: hypothetical protein AB7V43_14640 [Acidimicrobiia bacterium]